MNIEQQILDKCDKSEPNVFIDDAVFIARKADKKIAEIQDFAIWLTGCGYDFTQHEYYLKNRHLFTE